MGKITGYMDDIAEFLAQAPPDGADAQTVSQYLSDNFRNNIIKGVNPESKEEHLKEIINKLSGANTALSVVYIGSKFEKNGNIVYRFPVLGIVCFARDYDEGDESLVNLIDAVISRIRRKKKVILEEDRTFPAKQSEYWYGLVAFSLEDIL